MSVTQIVRGIGQGSIFGYGRFFGVHNPFGSSIGKAADPYINMRRVVLSANSPDQRLRDAVTGTLTAKIEHGFDPAVFPSINREVMLKALSKTDFVAHRLDATEKGPFISCVQRFVAGCSIEELGILSNSDSAIVFEAMQEAAIPHTQEILQTSFARYLAIFTPKEYSVKMFPFFKDLLPEHHVYYVRSAIDHAVDLLSRAHYEKLPDETYTRNAVSRELSDINPVLAELITARFKAPKAG